MGFKGSPVKRGRGQPMFFFVVGFFWGGGGGVNYPLLILPVVSCGHCVPNTQIVGVHALH